MYKKINCLQCRMVNREVASFINILLILISSRRKIRIESQKKYFIFKHKSVLHLYNSKSLILFIFIK